MEKERKEDNLFWWERKTSGIRTEYVYGLRDGTSNHGHTVIISNTIVYQRNLNEAKIIASGASLVLNFISDVTVSGAVLFKDFYNNC